MQLRVALGQSHRILPVSDWTQLDLGVRRTVQDVAVIDPLVDGADGTAQVRRFLHRHPSVPVILYVQLSPASLRAVVELAREAPLPVVLNRFDDEPARLRKLLERQPHERFAEELVERLTPALEGLPTVLASAVRELIRRPHRFWSAQDLASAAGCSRRSLYRQLNAAGLHSPRKLLQAARVLRAFVYLKDPGNLVEDVVTKLRYGSSHVFIRNTRECCGRTPSELRRKVDGHDLVETLARRLLDAPPGGSDAGSATMSGAAGP